MNTFARALTGATVLAASVSVVTCGGKDGANRGGLVLVIANDGTLVMDDLKVVVSARDQVLLQQDFQVPATPLPNTISIVSNGSPTDTATIAISAYKAGTPVDRRDAIVTQIPVDRVAVLRLVLSSACTAFVDADGSSKCDPGQTCDPGLRGCVVSTIDASGLPTYDPAEPLDAAIPDSSMAESSADAGADAALPRCGDGHVDPTEACDGVDVVGATCDKAKAKGWVGTVTCSAGCTLETSACAIPATTFNDLSTAANWSFFDLTTLDTKAKLYSAGGISARLAYFVPGMNGVFARLDTSKPFASASSWSTFDTSALTPDAKAFGGFVYDGRYAYSMPGATTTAIRLDTTAPFATASSWTTFDLASVNPALRGCGGTAFDGRYVYCVPGENQNGFSGLFGRLDTTKSFASSSSWEVFDLTTLIPGAIGFSGATFDGRYLYFAQWNDADGTALAVRFDTKGPFTAASSWSSFDLSNLSSLARGFIGASYDGRFVYLVPFWNGIAGAGGSSGLVVRYDTQASFAATASWETFDTTTVNPAAKGFHNARFDGRYLYFVPQRGTNGLTLYHGVVARYDTQGTFGSVGSWSAFDVSTLDTRARGFDYASFDGRFLYLVPDINASGTPDGFVARFEARSSSWLPAGVQTF